MLNVKQSELHNFKIPSSNMKKLLKKLSQIIPFDFFHLTPSPWDHSKNTSAQNFQFFTPSLLSLVRSCSFYMHPLSTYLRFSELPLPSLKKRSATLMTLI